MELPTRTGSKHTSDINSLRSASVFRIFKMGIIIPIDAVSMNDAVCWACFERIWKKQAGSQGPKVWLINRQLDKRNSTPKRKERAGQASSSRSTQPAQCLPMCVPCSVVCLVIQTLVRSERLYIYRCKRLPGTTCLSSLPPQGNQRRKGTASHYLGNRPCSCVRLPSKVPSLVAPRRWNPLAPSSSSSRSKH